MKLNVPHLPPSLAEILKRRKPIRNVNDEHEKSLSTLERVAIAITDKVGSMGFFLIIFGWTVLWCGYNILATEIPALHWASFDPFPAFVAYLLISNVIQIWLMPLLMVGQNLQSRHADLRAENDFEVNVKAEKEVEAIIQHLEHQNELLYALMQKVGLNVEEVLMAAKKEPTAG
ncbi:MAG TPA: DUF1003 domain-containing protein [Fimbriimonadaceae bacterium]|nr:DUF1003 domain-containing protein [Fimbriimonadaceae bacterium]